MKKGIFLFLIFFVGFAFGQYVPIENKNIDKTPLGESIYTVVDQTPEFPRGINAFRTKISENFKTKTISGNEGTLKATAKFYIDKNGKINGLTVSGGNSYFNNEIMRVLKSIKTTWIPAKINNEYVNSWFIIPITMNFE